MDHLDEMQRLLAAALFNEHVAAFPVEQAEGAFPPVRFGQHYSFCPSAAGRSAGQLLDGAQRRRASSPIGFLRTLLQLVQRFGTYRFKPGLIFG